MTPNPQDSAVALEVERAIREALMAGPTPGPWLEKGRVNPSRECIRIESRHPADEHHLYQVADVLDANHYQRNQANLAFILACNPESITALLAEIDRLRAPQSDGTSGGWISVDERLPGPGVIVLAFFRNCYGNGRVVRAHHAPKHTIEAGHWDEDAETDNTEDGSFEPEGWYEDPAAGETLTFISPQSDGVVSHWMTLPAAPTQGENHVG